MDPMLRAMEDTKKTKTSSLGSRRSQSSGQSQPVQTQTVTPDSMLSTGGEQETALSGDPCDKEKPPKYKLPVCEESP
jgi:hypothetical protein